MPALRFEPAGCGRYEQGKVVADLTIPPFRYEHVAKRGRGYLPHWEMEGATYSVTIRLGDSLPHDLREKIDFERKDIVKTAQQLGRDLTEQEKNRLAELHRRFDEALDAGYGSCCLAQPDVAEVVYNALLHFNGERYNMVAACVMPNHAHAVFSPAHGFELNNILHSWKSFTSNEANKILGRKGQFWEHEYFDRLVRDADELQRTVQYLIENPAKAGLHSWKWVWVHDAFRNAGFQPAPGQSRQDAGVTVGGQAGAARSIVRFRHLWGKTKRQQLLESADQNGKELYRELNPPLNLGLPLAPTQTDAGYLAWPLLPDLFPVSFPGVKTSRDDVVVDVDRQRLVDRMKQYFDPEVSHEEMRRISPGSMTSTARFQAESIRDYLRKRGFLNKNVVRYCYRPFDVRWLCWEPETKLLDEKRAEYFPQVFEGNIWLSAGQRNRKDDFYQPQVTSLLADHHLVESNVGMFPLWLDKLPGAKSLFASHVFADGKSPSGARRLNISDELFEYVARSAMIDAISDVFYHVIAVLHSPTYRRENGTALRQDWPRIPLPDSKELLLASAELGKQIASLLDAEAPFVTPASSRQPGDTAGITALQHIALFKLQPDTVLKEEDQFAITAGWGHAGKGGVTMPGKGKLVERDYTPADRTAGFQPAPESRQDAGATESVQRDTAGTLDDRSYDVYLNDVAYWSNIPARVWEYTIGGYQVIKKWLSYRELDLLGRPLTKEEVRYVQEMARRIAALIMLEPTLDENYRSVKAHSYPWPTKTKP